MMQLHFAMDFREVSPCWSSGRAGRSVSRFIVTMESIPAAFQPTWYQQWRVGDLVLWDNRCVMHRRDEFDPKSRRLMHRSQIKGDRPF
jgi:Taurine catabolism dioxygenase TauD, TfdA family